MAAGFEVDPEQLDGLAARFRQISQDLNDLGHLAPTAAAVDLQGTATGPPFAHAWAEFARVYAGLSDAAQIIGSKLNQSAVTYRDTDRSAAAKLDGVLPDRNRPSQ